MNNNNDDGPLFAGESMAMLIILGAGALSCIGGLIWILFG